MNIRKPADYTTMLAALDALMAAQLPQMELYCEIGRVVSGRGKKGAAVAASGGIPHRAGRGRGVFPTGDAVDRRRSPVQRGLRGPRSPLPRERGAMDPAVRVGRCSSGARPGSRATA